MLEIIQVTGSQTLCLGVNRKPQITSGEKSAVMNRKETKRGSTLVSSHMRVFFSKKTELVRSVSLVRRLLPAGRGGAWRRAGGCTCLVARGTSVRT